MILSLIVAASANNAIGRKGKLLWNLPDDTKFFKNTTWALPVIMGRKTYDSLGKALPGRTNIVITRNADWQKDDAMKVNNLEEAITEARKLHTLEVCVIGGGEIYREAMEVANRIYLTRVHEVFEDGDAFFPEIDPAKWELIFRRDHDKDAKHAYDFSFETWERK